MVIRSVDDYPLWKKQVLQYYINLFPDKKKYVYDYIKYVSKIYDNHKRSFLPYKLTWYLFNKRRWVISKNQHFWFAIIGKKGGEGKSTLAKNMLYFLDPTFDASRAALNYKDFLSLVLYTKEKLKLDYPAILMDEPDKSHQLSAESIKVRNVITKMRQLNMFVGVCANSLAEVPRFIYERMTCIIYINDRHRAWLYDNDKDKRKGTIIYEMKKDFVKTGHEVFKDFRYQQRACMKNFEFSKATPCVEGDYIENKRKDIISDINKILGKEEDIFALKRFDRDKKKSLIKLLKTNKPNLSDREIGELIGISRDWVNKLRNEIKDMRADLSL